MSSEIEHAYAGWSSEVPPLSYPAARLETIFTAVLLKHGPPPEKWYYWKGLSDANCRNETNLYSSWLYGCWTDIWNALPETAILPLLEQNGICGRAEQVGQVKFAFERWLHMCKKQEENRK